MTYSQLKLCFSCATSLADFFFHLGYQGYELPRFLRRLIAKRILHEAWLSGYTGAGIASVMEREEWKKPINNKCVY